MNTATALLLLGATLCAPAEQVVSAPNVVLFLVDDLGWRDAGFMGSDFYETPNMDRFAAEGMVFTAAYANAPNCSPSRACLLTGQYTPRHRVYTVGETRRGDTRQQALVPVPSAGGLEGSAVTLAELLGAAGYVSASIGKWHVGLDPIAQGFDVNVAGSSGSERKKRYFSPYGNPALSDGPEGEYLTDRLTDEAIAFVRENQERPFFLLLSHFAVHTPIRAKPELVAHFAAKPPSELHGNAEYAAMLSSVDQSLGRLLAELERLELDDDTLVILFSDNGGYESVTSMVPLRGAKGTLYEGGIRVPLAARWPGRIEGGARSNVSVSGVDLLPTALELAGVDAPSRIDGESLVPVLTGTGGLEREALYWHFPAYLGALEREGPLRARPAGAVRRGRYKLIEFFEDGSVELYDLEADVGEAVDLAREQPGLASELQGQLAAWRESLRAELPSQPNPAYDPDFVPRKQR